MTPLLIFPTEAEAAPVRAARADLDIRICGVGLVETAITVDRIIAQEHPVVVVLCGIAGAYDSSLAIGDVVAVFEERTSTLPSPYINRYKATLKLPLAEVVSNSVMSVGAAACGAQIENMEGASLFAVCSQYGVQCAEIRAISNYTNDSRELWDIPAALNSLVKAINKLF